MATTPLLPEDKAGIETGNLLTANNEADIVTGSLLNAEVVADISTGGELTPLTSVGLTPLGE